MIKKIDKYVILVITESFWKKHGRTGVMNNTCSHTIDRVWIDREICSEIMQNDELMNSLYSVMRYDKKIDKHELITRI